MQPLSCSKTNDSYSTIPLPPCKHFRQPFDYNIKRISQFLPGDKLEMALQAFVTSRIDYCNGLLYRLPDCEIAKLQRVAARLLMSCKRYDHMTPVLVNLHWLPVRYRINFKILLLTFKAPYRPLS